jgi:hypothetical protein
LTKFGDELGTVEIDFFAVISHAAESGISRKEIDAAYRAASSQAFNKRRRGERGADKIKNVDLRFAEMLEVLVADPSKRIFTAAKEVLGNVPERGRPTPEHLARVFNAKAKKSTRNLEILRTKLLIFRVVKQIEEFLNLRSGYDREREQLQWVLGELRLPEWLTVWATSQGTKNRDDLKSMES